MANGLQELYRKDVRHRLAGKLGYSNPHQVPRLVKVVVNTCVGSCDDVKQALEDAKSELSTITGQKAAETRSKKSIANFKVRQHQAIGARVTLRGARMYEFLDRLIRMALPRIRDFRGVSARSFDGNGNYSLGLREQSIFPEIELDKVKRTVGFDVTIVTSCRSDNEAKLLLIELGMPFSDKGKVTREAQS